MTRYVALYCRLSPRPDGSYEGVDIQEQWGRDYAERAWPGVPVRVFADKGISAANGDDRPQYEALRAAVRAGDVAHIWTVEQSRLERREVEWFTLAAEMDAAGIAEIHTNRDGVVRVRDDVAGIKAVINAGEVRKLKRRVNDRLDEIAAQGRPSGSKPFGYEHAEVDGIKTYVQVPEQAAALRWAADKLLSGWSLSNIARELRARGMVGAHGGTITPQSVRSALTAPTVAGLRVHRGEIRGRGLWEPILDETTWRAVAARLDRPRTVQRSDGGEHRITDASRVRAGRRYLLTGGLAVCKCGAPLVGAVKQYRSGQRQVSRPYLTCRTERGGCGRIGIILDDTERYVVNELFAELDKPEFLDAVGADDAAARRDALADALGEADRQRRELAKMWARPGQLTTGEWQAARDALAEREAELRAELRAVPPPLVGIDIDEVRAAWPDMTLDEQREFLRMFIVKVTVTKAKPGTKKFDSDRVGIEWRTLRQ